MLLEAEFSCAFCGEPNATTVDPSAGRFQEYVEDCQVCCRPNVLSVEVDASSDPPVALIQADPESD